MLVHSVVLIIYKVIVDLHEDGLAVRWIPFENALNRIQIEPRELKDFWELAGSQLTLGEQHLSFAVHDMAFLTDQVALGVDEVPGQIDVLARLCLLSDNIKVVIKFECAHYISDLKLSARVVVKFGQTPVFVQQSRLKQLSAPVVDHRAIRPNQQALLIYFSALEVTHRALLNGLLESCCVSVISEPFETSKAVICRKIMPLKK